MLGHGFGELTIIFMSGTHNVLVMAQPLPEFGEAVFPVTYNRNYFFLLSFYICLFYFWLYECFACMFVCVPCECPIKSEGDVKSHGT